MAPFVFMMTGGIIFSMITAVGRYIAAMVHYEASIARAAIVFEVHCIIIGEFNQNDTCT